MHDAVPRDQSLAHVDLRGDLRSQSRVQNLGDGNTKPSHNRGKERRREEGREREEGGRGDKLSKERTCG